MQGAAEEDGDFFVNSFKEREENEKNASVVDFEMII